MFSIVLDGVLYIGVSCEFKTETIDNKHYLTISNTGVVWLMKEYNDIATADSKLDDIIAQVVNKDYHLDLDTLL